MIESFDLALEDEKLLLMDGIMISFAHGAFPLRIKSITVF